MTARKILALALVLVLSSVAWGQVMVSPPRGIGFGMSFGAGSPVGSTRYFVVPVSCSLANWSMTVTSGTATIDIWKIAAGNGLPTVANTITAAALPAIASGTTLTSSTLTGWTTAVAAFDVVAFNIAAISGSQAVSITLGCM